MKKSPRNTTNIICTEGSNSLQLLSQNPVQLPFWMSPVIHSSGERVNPARSCNKSVTLCKGLISKPGANILNNISTRFNNLGNNLMQKYIFKVYIRSIFISFNCI